MDGPACADSQQQPPERSLRRIRRNKKTPMSLSHDCDGDDSTVHTQPAAVKSHPEPSVQRPPADVRVRPSHEATVLPLGGARPEATPQVRLGSNVVYQMPFHDNNTMSNVNKDRIPPPFQSLLEEPHPNDIDALASNLLALLAGEDDVQGIHGSGLPQKIDVNVLQSILAEAGVTPGSHPSTKQTVPETPSPSTVEPCGPPATGCAPRKSNKRKSKDEVAPEQSLNATHSAALTQQQGLPTTGKPMPSPAPRFVPMQLDVNTPLDQLSPWEAARMIDELLKKQLATAMCLQVSLQQVTAACMQAQGQFHEQLATLVTLNSAVQHKSLIPMLAASIREQRDAGRKKQKSTKTQKEK